MRAEGLICFGASARRRERSFSKSFSMEVNNMQLTKDSLILDVITAYPETREVFAGLGMGCLDCLGVGSETLESGACMHRLDVTAVIAALSRVIGDK